MIVVCSMMNSIRIYLGGKMTGLSYEDMQGWRFELESHIHDYVKANDILYRVNVFNPCDYYNPLDDVQKSDREAMEFDIYNLKRSDMLIANLDMQDSIGTAMEIAIARDNGIPIVAMCENEDGLHPWLRDSCVRICNNMEELVEYITEYYIFPLLV